MRGNRHILALTAAGLLIFIVGCWPSIEKLTGPDPATETFAPSLGVNLKTMVKREDALYLQDLAPGVGPPVTDSLTLTVHYICWLKDATLIDSGTTKFVIGVHKAIMGWDKGIVGMSLHGKRRLVIGAALAYGAKGSAPIPGNATLIYNIDLLGVASGAAANRLPTRPPFIPPN